MSQRLLLTILILLSGCAHYVEPFGGSSAKLRLVTLPGNPTEVHVLDDPRCIGNPGKLIAKLGLSVKDGTNQGRNLQMPLQDGIPRLTATELGVHVNQPFAAQFKAAGGRGPKHADWSYPACSKSFVIAPKDNENYEVQLEQLAEGCILNVFRISREKDGSYVRRIAPNAQVLKARCN